MPTSGIELRIGQTDQGAGADPTRFANFYTFDVQRPGSGQPAISLSELLVALRRVRLQPSPLSLDWLAVACTAYAADTTVDRYTNSDDGWTRQFELFVPVSDVAVWDAQAELLATILNFLTGDLWKLTFRPSTAAIVVARRSMKPVTYLTDTVCLFSGGMDSFLGAMKLLDDGVQPLLVGHAKSSDVSDFRNQAAQALRTHYPSFNLELIKAFVRVKKPRRTHETVLGESTERGRSFLFLALGAACASALPGPTRKNLWIPENGFITLNLPLSPLRMGAYSTRTTHPYYLQLVQQLMDNLALNTAVHNPFEFFTKGEMLANCSDPAFAASVNTMSCSRPATRNARLEGAGTRHCGRCVPCIIRRAALHKAGIRDDNALLPADRRYRTDIYRQALHASTANATNKGAKGENVMALRYMLARTQADPQYLAAAIQLTGPLMDPQQSLDVYQRGLAEVAAILRRVNVLP